MVSSTPVHEPVLLYKESKVTSPTDMNSSAGAFSDIRNGPPCEADITVIEPGSNMSAFLAKRFADPVEDGDDLLFSHHSDTRFDHDVLQRRLKEEGGDSPSDSPDTPPGGHDVAPFDHMDHETQMSLVMKSEGLHIHDDKGHLLFPHMTMHGDETNFESENTTFDCESSTMPAPIVDSTANNPFVFKQFGSDVEKNGQGIPLVTPTLTTLSPTISPSNHLRSPKNSIPAQNEAVVIASSNVTTGFVNKGPVKRTKEPSLSANCVPRAGDIELKIMAQPEDQHRARYMTEGSRGAIKDKSQQGFPTVKLTGYSKPIQLQIFIGNDTGKVKPHGFYQACRVQGKNSTHCSEREIEGTAVIEFPFDTANEMTAVIDSVGILKLRNADVEQRIGVSRSKKKKVPTATLR